jgi:hypothetical protein
VWILPKVIGNTPQDRFQRHPMVEPSRLEHLIREHVPKGLLTSVTDRIIETTLNFVVGSPTRVGLKLPKEPFHMRHPTVSQEIHNRLVHGDITPKGNIEELQGTKVMFEDGSVEEVDAIIYATGYNVTFPFFDEDFISAPDNEIALFERIFDPRFDNLAFIALVQPVCAMMPIAELQSNLVADYLVGDYRLPVDTEMDRRASSYDSDMKSRYTASESHTIQIDCAEYSYYLREEWKRGAERARAAGGTPLVLAIERANE